MKFKDWITWIFVRPITKKPAYYKRKDGTIILTVKNCDITLKEIADIWYSNWKAVANKLPTNLAFAGLRAYDFYWDNTSIDRTPNYETPTLIDLFFSNFYTYFVSDKTGAERKLDIWEATYAYKGKDLIITISYEYTAIGKDDY
jgi:hypothetical protein|nr:MAG TPA: hypothetical protein [Caudoviricetes sp.]